MSLIAQEELTPRAIVRELDRHIVGQNDAKRAVAIALRHRWRRRHLPTALARDTVPKNILMMGPTGVGKTEIARRLARLVQAPFVKVEATRFTEIGYVGRDVEQIVRDLVEEALVLVRESARVKHKRAASAQAEKRLLKALGDDEGLVDALRAGALDRREVDIALTPPANQPTLTPGNMMDPTALQDILKGFATGEGTKPRRVRTTVADAREALESEIADSFTEQTSLHAEAVSLAENDGIVFLDEIDKLCHGDSRSAGEVSREGVQRDLLPILEGASVSTRYGVVHTDHVLFVACGAFHGVRPSDLLPELQGRLPIRVELSPLDETSLRRILAEPETSLIRQYEALLATEGVTLSFAEDGLDALAEVAARLNRQVENIGARRLHTVLERTLEEISFTAPDARGATIAIDRAYVEDRLQDAVKIDDPSRFIL